VTALALYLALSPVVGILAGRCIRAGMVDQVSEAA
jgi:hypothetical protein